MYVYEHGLCASANAAFVSAWHGDRFLRVRLKRHVDKASTPLVGASIAGRLTEPESAHILVCPKQVTVRLLTAMQEAHASGWSDRVHCCRRCTPLGPLPLLMSSTMTRTTRPPSQTTCSDLSVAVMGARRRPTHPRTPDHEAPPPFSHHRSQTWH